MSARLGIAGAATSAVMMLVGLMGACSDSGDDSGATNPDGSHGDAASEGGGGGVIADAAPDDDGLLPPDGGETPDGDAVSPEGAACPAGSLRFGVNLHDAFGNAAAVADIMEARHFTTGRMDYWGLDKNYVATFRNSVTVLAAHGVTVQAVVFDDYGVGYAGYGDGSNCNVNLKTVEDTAYNQTYTSVQQVEDLVTDFEMLNEISLYPNLRVAGTTGQSASDWNTACGLLEAANLRGMSRAIRDRAVASGRPLRIILGVVNRHWGFLNFMLSQNVQFDVVGYHIYPWEAHAPLDQDPWFGPGGALGQLALFNRPIHVNEFNCGEIYSGTGDYSSLPGYENQPGQPVTEQCLRSVTKHLLEIANQTVANVESMHWYEIFDEPSKAPPENRFGLLEDVSTPKMHLYLASAFAGGTLSGMEENEITSRSLLTSAQISSWAGCGAGQ